MASYSMELWEMVENPLTPLFNFNYDFYCDDLEVKKKFEEKFINHYWLYEIGCETPARWNQMLKSRLNLIMPYYRQLYQTELASQNIDFLLNKDLTESTTRELTGVENDNILDMIRYLSKAFTMASIARVFGYTRENIRQICADNEE